MAKFVLESKTPAKVPVTYKIDAAVKRAVEEISRKAEALGRSFPAAAIVEAALSKAVKQAERELASSNAADTGQPLAESQT